MSVQEKHAQIGPLRVGYLVGFRNTLLERAFSLLIVVAVVIMTMAATMEIAQGPVLIAGITAIGLVAVLLIYGIRINELDISTSGIHIDFEDSPDNKD
jgi:hypothetical protein